MARSQRWQRCPPARMPLPHPKGCEEETSSSAFLRRTWQERGGSELPALEEQTRHQLLPEVSLGNAELIGALGIAVPLHICCLKIELKCDCSRYSLAVNKEIEHIAMQSFVYFSIVVCKLLKSIDCSFLFQGQLPVSLRKSSVVPLV